jgi:hypothetical protein
MLGRMLFERGSDHWSVCLVALGNEEEHNTFLAVLQRLLARRSPLSDTRTLISRDDGRSFALWNAVYQRTAVLALSEKTDISAWTGMVQHEGIEFEAPHQKRVSMKSWTIPVVTLLSKRSFQIAEKSVQRRSIPFCVSTARLCIPFSAETADALEAEIAPFLEKIKTAYAMTQPWDNDLSFSKSFARFAQNCLQL